MIPWAILRAAAFASLVGCGPPGGEGTPASADQRTLRQLWVATDLDPADDVVEVTIIAEPGVAPLDEGLTSVLGYRDGGDPSSRVTVPGPLIVAKVGDRLRVHFVNALPGLTTTLHWHGLRLPVAMDGNPMVSGAVPPGGTFEYDFVLRDAGLFWYHPHVDTDVQLESGLQGVLLVREAEPPLVDRERIFVLDDVSLTDDGSVDVDLDIADAMLGRRGDRITVNGGPAGVVLANAGAVERWRLVNTANGRYFDLSLDGLPLRVIGWDGGLLSEPYEVDVLRVAPGERYDVIVKLPAEGDSVVLETLAVDRGGGQWDEAAPLVEVSLRASATVASVVPTTSRSIAAMTPESVRSFVLSSKLDGPTAPVFFINDQRWPLNTPIEVSRGEADVWEVVNDEDHHHPFHIHGLFFQVLDIDGVAPGVVGWKDTVDIPPRATARLAVPYDEPGMWMFHCQIPEHAERGMMGDLLVMP